MILITLACDNCRDLSPMTEVSDRVLVEPLNTYVEEHITKAWWVMLESGMILCRKCSVRVAMSASGPGPDE